MVVIISTRTLKMNIFFKQRTAKQEQKLFTYH